jgi:hypothetical protein
LAELQETVYDEIELPPLLVGGLKVTLRPPVVDVVDVADAFALPGALGATAAIKLFDAEEGGPEPTALVAYTVQV